MGDALHKGLTETERVHKLKIGSYGKIDYPIKDLERTTPGLKQGREAILECTSEGKTFYCRYRGTDKNGPIKSMIFYVPREIGREGERHDFTLKLLTPEAFAKRIPETKFPDDFPKTLIPADRILRNMSVEDSRATLEIKGGAEMLTVEGLLKEFRFDDYLKAATMKIEVGNAIAFAIVHNGLNKACIELPERTEFRESVTAFLDEIEAKANRSASGAVRKLMRDLGDVDNFNPQTFNEIRDLCRKALECSPSVLFAMLRHTQGAR